MAANSPFNPQYAQGPSLGGSNYPAVQGNLADVLKMVMSAYQGGRPGTLDYLFKVLDAVGSAETGQMQRHQYETMAPYMTDPAQQQRWSFPTQLGQQQAQLTAQNQANTQNEQRWGQVFPFMKDYYNTARQNIGSPYLGFQLPVTW